MKMNKIIFLFFFCLSFNLYASDDNIKIKVEEVTTEEGFKFLFVERHDLPKVSLNISFKDAGYAYEDSKKQGLAWLTSLVIQEGSGENDAKDFAKKLEEKGIRLHFSTGLETFRASLETLSENLEDGISLLSDAIIRPRVDSDGFNRTVEMAKVNLNYFKQSAYLVGAQALDELLFKDHPYSKNQYGSLDTIMNITKSDILGYIKDNFTKDNIVISVVGCVEKEKVMKLLDEYLSELPSKRSGIKEIPVKNDFDSAESKHIFMDIPQSVILFAQKGVSYGDPDYYNASVLINALGGMGLNSVLMKELRQNLGITYGVNAYMVNNKHGNLIAGSINTDSSTANKSISAIKEVLGKVKEEGIDEQLFKDTKVSMVNSFIFSLLNNGNIAMLLDRIQLYDFDHNYINEYTDYIEDVELEDINKLADSLLDPENLFFVEVGRNT